MVRNAVLESNSQKLAPISSAVELEGKELIAIAAKDEQFIKNAKEELSKTDQLVLLENFLPPPYNLWPFQQLLNVQ